MIRVENLVYEYPTSRALHGVSLEVEPGSITALVGPNGAGKTTLLRCLAALELPYSGAVTIDGLDTQASPREVHERVGYLPDFFGLYEELTVQQCLFFAARAHGLSPEAAEKAVHQTAERIVLRDRLGSKAGELSRGLRQRLAIGQAIVHEPRVLLLDEPASGLDPEARRSLSALLLQLRELGMTQIVSSHILAELEDYSSHMIIMERGRIVSSRSVAESGPVRTTVRIELVAADDRLGAFLEGRDDVSVVEIGEASAVLIMEGGRAERADLLKALIEAGFAVSQMSEQRQRLEDAYFEEIRAKRPGNDSKGE